MLPNSIEEAEKIKEFVYLLDNQILIEKNKLNIMLKTKKSFLHQIFS